MAPKARETTEPSICEFDEDDFDVEATSVGASEEDHRLHLQELFEHVEALAAAKYRPPSGFIRKLTKEHLKFQEWANKICRVLNPDEKEQ